MSDVLVKNVIVHEKKKDESKLKKNKKETPVSFVSSVSLSPVSPTLSSSGTREGKTQRTRTSLHQLVPIYINELLPPETHEYPLVSYERAHGPGYLYMLRESNYHQETGMFYKLGVTNDLKKRLRDIQNGNPRPLIPECLIKVKEMDKVTTAIEATLGMYGVTLHGGKDWYRAESAEDLQAVLQEISGIRRRMRGVEIPVDQFIDYVNYYIHFDDDV